MTTIGTDEIEIRSYPITKAGEIIGWTLVIDNMMFADRFATQKDALEAGRVAVEDLT